MCGYFAARAAMHQLGPAEAYQSRHGNRRESGILIIQLNLADNKAGGAVSRMTWKDRLFDSEPDSSRETAILGSWDETRKAENHAFREKD